jgi:hypothetical protein
VNVTLLPVLEGAIHATAALLMLGFAVGRVDAAVVRRNGPLARTRVDDGRVVTDFKTSFKEVNPLQSSCELRVAFSGSDGSAGPRLPSGLWVDTVIVPSIARSRILDISVALGSNMWNLLTGVVDRDVSRSFCLALSTAAAQWVRTGVQTSSEGPRQSSVGIDIGVVLALDSPAGSSSGIQVLMTVAVRMFGHEILDIVVMLKLDVLGLCVLRLGVLRLCALRLGVLRLSVLRLVVLKLDVLGLDVLGLDVLGLDVLGLEVLILDMLSLLDRVVHGKGTAINFDRREQSELGALLSVVIMAGQAIGQVDADLFQIPSLLQSAVLCSFDEVLHRDSPAMVGDWHETASVHGNRISHAAAVAGVDSLREEIELL